MTTIPFELPRRSFLLGAGTAAGLAAITHEAGAAAAVEQAPDQSGSFVITISDAISGVPYALETSALDEQEFARRARHNTTVFRAAWVRALQSLRSVSAPETSTSSGFSTVSAPVGGAVIRIPPGFYPIDTWDMSVTPTDLGLPGSEASAQQPYGEWSLRIVIEADGAVLIAKDYAGAPTTDHPVVYLGSPTSPGRSVDLLKRVTIRGLSVQSDTNPSQSFTSTDRVAVVVHQSQEVYFERVSIYGFRREGLRLEGVMDSTFTGVNIGWCAPFDGAESSPGRFALALVTTESNGSPVENCNALRFVGCHIECCGRELSIDRGSRHVDFIGSKFEHGWGTVSSASPVQIGRTTTSSPSTSYVHEISFVACMFVQNTYGFEGNHPSHISIEEVGYIGSHSEKAKTSVSFTTCHFTVPDGGGERWFTGSDASFTSCDFNGCGNADGEPACFDLGNDVIFTSCRFSAARTIHGGLEGDPGTGGGGAPLRSSRADLFRFRGGASRIVHPVIYFPARSDGVDAAPGSLATLARGAGNGNTITGWQTHWYGLPQDAPGAPGHIQPVRYEDSQRSQLLSTLTIDAWSKDVSGVLEPDANGVVSVVGKETVKLRSGSAYNNFSDGYSGQVVRVVSDGGTATLNPGSFVLRPSASPTVPPGAMRSFVMYVDGLNSAWFEL